MTESAVHLKDEINRRLTLNLLIQGAAGHAILTSHYIVRDDLAAMDPNLLQLYDQLAAVCSIGCWRDGYVLVFGWPGTFWRRTASPKHPFHGHPLLARHGLKLALVARQRADVRCRVKRVSRLPGWFTLQCLIRCVCIEEKEEGHRAALVDLAKQATHEVWGIPIEKLDAALTSSVEFGDLSRPATIRGRILRSDAAGYGGVVRTDGGLRVVAKASTWPLLSHELVKGTVELICLHGLNQLDDVTYAKVVKATDRIEYEPWMVQVGSELWRQLLPLLPDDRPVADMVMHMARLPARSLEQLMLAVVEDSDWARGLFAELGQEEDRWE